jgi:nucleotide-binding universal stress UspA family protein
MIKNILLATDGSDHAWTAWQYAVDIARAYDAWLRVVSVVDVRVFQQQAAVGMGGLYPTSYEPLISPDVEQKMEEEQTELLEEVRRKTEAAGVKVQVSLMRGTPAPGILSHEPFADIIALGHRGHRSPWDVFFLGSVAEDVIRRASKPVLITPEQYTPIERILASYDGSPPSQRALHWAADMATMMKLPLDVVHVNFDHPAGRTVLREAHEYLRAYETIRNVETILRTGQAEEEILATATERGAGLIVMGAHGHSRLYESLLGSVTNEVLRHSDKPLLMTR